jgi:GGDEF domain-containing protein
MRRISTALFGAGMIVVLLVANSKAVLPQLMNRTALNWVVLAAGLSVVAILLFPWRRYDRNLFLLAPLAGLCLIALAVFFSGGWESPFFPFYSFVVVFCAIYFSPQIAALVFVVSVLFSLSPQLYGPDATGLAEHVTVRVPTYLALALVTWYMAREVGRRERLRGEYERELRAMQELKDRFQRASLTDLITGLHNRRGFEDQLTKECNRARRSEEAFTVILLDLDDFKEVNDEYGHRTGDESLRIVADALRSSARETDVLARYGGEEFTVVLPTPQHAELESSSIGLGRRWPINPSDSWASRSGSAPERPTSLPMLVTPTGCSKRRTKRCTRQNVEAKTSSCISLQRVPKLAFGRWSRYRCILLKRPEPSRSEFPRRRLLDNP